MTPRQAVTDLLEANQGDTMKTAAAVLAIGDPLPAGSTVWSDAALSALTGR